MTTLADLVNISSAIRILKHSNRDQSRSDHEIAETSAETEPGESWSDEDLPHVYAVCAWKASFLIGPLLGIRSDMHESAFRVSMLCRQIF